MYSLRNKRVWVAGHRGLVGAALVRRLAREDCIVQKARRENCDLRVAAELDRWMRENRPQAVFLAAARVGGIYANDTHPAEFIYDNLMIQSNVVDAARRHGVERLLFLGSSCIYPRLAPQPIAEDALLTGPLEPTNQWYAVAKIAGVKLCQAYRRQYGCDFIAAMPTNLYGPGDNFDRWSSHVVPALIAKAHEAKTGRAPALTVWGSGRPLRELLYVDDAADGLVFLMKHYADEMPINLGSGQEISIGDLARLIGDVVGFDGTLAFDRAKPDGTPRKVLDGTRLAGMGWRAETTLADGLARTYRWYLDHHCPAGSSSLAHA
ncbi:MAG TPA: GDP-L-fucose synthase [Stellaceae bacterium]|nr:GDP-L-fucose synthase [Stellaceae bacterium]